MSCRASSSGTAIVVIGEPGAADEAASALAKRDAMSSGSLTFFSSAGTIPSITTSDEASLDRSDTSAGRAATASSELLIAGMRATPKNLPFRSRPSSSSPRSTKIVSGKSPQTPALEMFISPARCMSAMSFGRVLNTRYSEKTEPAVFAITPSIVAPSADSISTISEDGSPRRASLLRYSSWPCSMRTELTVSRMSDEVR